MQVTTRIYISNASFIHPSSDALQTFDAPLNMISGGLLKVHIFTSTEDKQSFTTSKPAGATRLFSE